MLGVINMIKILVTNRHAHAAFSELHNNVNNRIVMFTNDNIAMFIAKKVLQIIRLDVLNISNKPNELSKWVN